MPAAGPAALTVGSGRKTISRSLDIGKAATAAAMMAGAGSSVGVSRRPEDGGREGGEAMRDASLSEVDIPFGLVNLVVHADQRRAPLRTFHFADTPPTPTPAPTPTPRSDPRSRRVCEGERRGSSREQERRGGGRGGTENVAEGRGQGYLGQEPEEVGSLTDRCCATCEALPVIRMEEGGSPCWRGGRSSTAAGFRRDVTGRGGGGYARSEEGCDDEANKQVCVRVHAGRARA